MNQFKNKVLYIESNEMLEEVSKLLGIKIEDFLEDHIGRFYNWLVFDEICLCTRNFAKEKSEITLEEFKELLKQ